MNFFIFNIWNPKFDVFKPAKMLLLKADYER